MTRFGWDVIDVQGCASAFQFWVSVEKLPLGFMKIPFGAPFCGWEYIIQKQVDVLEGSTSELLWIKACYEPVDVMRCDLLRVDGVESTFERVELNPSGADDAYFWLHDDVAYIHRDDTVMVLGAGGLNAVPLPPVAPAGSLEPCEVGVGCAGVCADWTPFRLHPDGALVCASSWQIVVADPDPKVHYPGPYSELIPVPNGLVAKNDAGTQFIHLEYGPVAGCLDGCPELFSVGCE